MKLWIIVAGLVICLLILGASLTNLKPRKDEDDIMYERLFASQTVSSNSDIVNSNLSVESGSNVSSDSQVNSQGESENTNSNSSEANLVVEKSKEELIAEYEKQMNEYSAKVVEYYNKIEELKKSE